MHFKNYDEGSTSLISKKVFSSQLDIEIMESVLTCVSVLVRTKLLWTHTDWRFYRP